MTSARPKISPAKNPPACSKCQSCGIIGTLNKSIPYGNKEPHRRRTRTRLRNHAARRTRRSHDETLIVWAGEFGRTPFSQSSNGCPHKATSFLSAR
ncbi:MAG: DUF1501 domain-containing protein [Planctomycetota bacterium]|nr:DUF1501 domain-containing protein [Planctomycetota bacterium]